MGEIGRNDGSCPRLAARRAVHQLQLLGAILVGYPASRADLSVDLAERQQHRIVVYSGKEVRPGCRPWVGEHKIVKLPPDQLARLRAHKAGSIQVGDVWWLPAKHVGFFPGGKDRFCLVAGIEPTAGGTPGLIHVVGGSTKVMTGPKAIRMAAGDCGLSEETYFKFLWSDSVAVAVLMNDGKWKGRLGSNRLAEIKTAVMASKLMNLKRLW